MCRAEANGHVVAVRDGKVTVGPPATGAEPVVTAQFGATVLELDAEIDARWQVKGVKAKAWNATDQELVEADAAEPSVTASGNLSASDLADVIGGDPHLLRHGGKLGEPELQAWADGRLLKDRLAKVRGRVRFQGFARRHRGRCRRGRPASASASPASSTWPGVRHTFANGNWETDVAFGLAPETYAATYPVTRPPAGGLLPAVNGLQIGIVTALQDDPDGEDRIKVRLPLVSDSEEGVWARLATLDAGDERGTFFRPEIDDEVVVGFLDGDPRFPVVLGQCHSSAKPAPEPATDDNHLKGYVSRSKLKLTFDDDKKVVVLETPAGNKLTLSEDDKTVVAGGPERQQGHARRRRHHARERQGPDPQGVRRREARGHERRAQGAGELQGRGAGRRRRQVQRDPDHQGLAGPDQLRRSDVFPAARVTDQIVSTATQGAPVPIIPPGAPTVLIGGMPAATLGDSCGADTIVKGSATVLIGGKPAARVADSTAGGGIVMPPGEPTVLIGG